MKVGLLGKGFLADASGSTVALQVGRNTAAGISRHGNWRLRHAAEIRLSPSSTLQIYNLLLLNLIEAEHRRMKYRAWLFLVPGMLAGCGTTWHNANISDPSALARQLAIDEGYCTRVAAGAAPMPEIRLDTSSQQSYAVSGTTTTLGPNGPQTSFHSGTITPTNNFGSGFSSGIAQGAALGATIQAKRERDAVIKGCMFNLGWSDTAKPASADTDSQPARPQRIQSPAVPATVPRDATGTAAPKREDSANLSCDQWVNDVAVVVDSAQANGMKREDLARTSQDYLTTVNASGRDHLIFGYIISARYQISSTELSSENFPRFIRWECEKDWSGIGLGKS